MIGRLAADERGALFLEAFIGFVPVAFLFVLMCQIADLYANQLIVQRAASVAARAAVVVLPDDGARYGDPDNRLVDRFVGGRKRAIEEATEAVLAASPSLSQRDVLEVSGPFVPRARTSVRVTSRYTCLFRQLPLVCGADGVLQLKAAATLPYQGASYRYGRGG